MKLLALDTTEKACSAALLIDGETRQRLRLEPRAHARLILPMIDELMAEAGLAPGALDLLAFARGPGSFTGLRIAAGVAQGIAFGADLPVMPVSSLRGLAQGVWREHGAERVLAAFDARMNEVYDGAFALFPTMEQEQVMQALEPERVSAPAALDATVFAGRHWVGAGSGWAACPGLGERLKPCASFPDSFSQARDIGACALADHFAGIEPVPAEQALPVYLRDRVAIPKV